MCFVHMFLTFDCLIYSFIYLSVRLSVYSFIYLFIYIPFIHLSIHLSMCLSIFLSFLTILFLVPGYVYRIRSLTIFNGLKDEFKLLFFFFFAVILCVSVPHFPNESVAYRSTLNVHVFLKLLLECISMFPCR